MLSQNLNYNKHDKKVLIPICTCLWQRKLKRMRGVVLGLAPFIRCVVLNFMESGIKIPLQDFSQYTIRTITSFENLKTSNAKKTKQYQCL